MNINRSNPCSFSFSSKDMQTRDWEGFLAAFKRAVPSQMREYDPEARTWFFSPNYLEQFEWCYSEYLEDKATPKLF